MSDFILQMPKSRILIGVILTLVMHLSAIPIMALYGLRICPVLSDLGFWGNCIYLSSYIGAVLTLNFMLLYRVYSSVQGQTNTELGSWLLKFPRYSFFIYLFATALSLVVLYAVFQMQHISSASRAPEVLIVVSLLLGVFQYYLINWLVQPLLVQIKNSHAQAVGGGIEFFNKTWVESMAFGFSPIMLVLLVGIHFVTRQSYSLNQGHIAPEISTDELAHEVILVFAIFMVWLFAVYSLYFASEADQAKRIGHHLKKISDLDLTYRSNTWVRGVWAPVLMALNKTSELLGEKTRLMDSFSKFVASSVAQQAVAGEVRVGGERKELTVLMSDLRNFTVTSEMLHPESVVKLLNIYFSEMLDELNRHGIIVDKFIGDGILGYVEDSPIANDQQSETGVQNEKAVKAALGMLNRLKVVNEKMRAENFPVLKMGVGIYRGPVILGNIGSESRMQYTIMSSFFLSGSLTQ